MGCPFIIIQFLANGIGMNTKKSFFGRSQLVLAIKLALLR
jgi:hypothetical protein